MGRRHWAPRSTGRTVRAELGGGLGQGWIQDKGQVEGGRCWVNRWGHGQENKRKARKFLRGEVLMGTLTHVSAHRHPHTPLPLPQ